jgi:hypothetical protein
MREPIVVTVALPATPPCPLCGALPSAKYAWGPFSASHVRVRSVRHEGRLLRLLKCVRCLAYHHLALESPAGDG